MFSATSTMAARHCQDSTVAWSSVHEPLKKTKKNPRETKNLGDTARESDGFDLVGFEETVRFQTFLSAALAEARCLNGGAAHGFCKKTWQPRRDPTEA